MNRTAANPVVVYLILHDVVVPGLPVDEVVEFEELEPGAVDEMLPGAGSAMAGGRRQALPGPVP